MKSTILTNLSDTISQYQLECWVLVFKITKSLKVKNCLIYLFDILESLVINHQLQNYQTKYSIVKEITKLHSFELLSEGFVELM